MLNETPELNISRSRLWGWGRVVGSRGQEFRQEDQGQRRDWLRLHTFCRIGRDLGRKGLVAGIHLTPLSNLNGLIVSITALTHQNIFS